MGPNGTGKTTLLKILADKEDADGGSVAKHPSLHLGYLEQQPEWAPGRTLIDEAKALAGLVAMQEELVSVAEALAHCQDPLEHKRLADRYDHLQHEMLSRDAYNLNHKIERVLDGLRFRRETFNQPVESLSGGEQNRLMLAKLLLAEPNVMLLDEPSNHLDIEATEWLEGFLAKHAAMVLVSHDRYFLNRVTNRTLELFQGTVDSYTGNFSAYWTQKAERLLVSADLREAADRDREGQGVHPPQPLRAKAPAGRRPPQKLERMSWWTCRGRSSCRRWASRPPRVRRYRGPRRRAGQVLRAAAVR